MKYTDVTARSARPARKREPVEEATRRNQPWPGPLPDEFLHRLGQLDEVVMATEQDRDEAVWQREQALQTISERHYEQRHLDPGERHRYALLLQQVIRAQPVIDAHERARTERDKMAAWYDRVRLGTNSYSMDALEAELGPFDGSAVWWEMAGNRVAKSRRQYRDDGPSRGAVLPPPGGIPDSGHWRG